MIVSFSIQDGRGLEPDEIDAINAVISDPLEFYPMDCEHEWMRGRIRNGSGLTGNLEAVMKVVPKGVSITLDGTTPVSVYGAILAELRFIKDKVLQLDLRDTVHPQQHNRMYNDNHVASESLLRVRETRVFDDCCTEVIDKKLTEGWRILAVVPQPDQRRPDYILGRMERNENDD